MRNGNLWADGRFDLGNFKANVGAKLGFSSFWREGLVRKGLFAGLDTDQSLPTAWDGGANAIRNEYNEIIVKESRNCTENFFSVKITDYHLTGKSGSYYIKSAVNLVHFKNDTTPCRFLQFRRKNKKKLN